MIEEGNQISKMTFALMQKVGYSFPTHDTAGKKTDVPAAEVDDIQRPEKSRSA